MEPATVSQSASASRPALLTVDDDNGVLRAVERDLRKHYGQDYRVLRADSGKAALDALRQLQTRNQPCALMLVDYRMPEMNGIQLLQNAMQIYPEAKRVLLTAYADTDAAIQAINKAKLHHYLLKPWDPPEQNLYPVVDDLLEDWQANYHPPFEGLRVLGSRWSPRAYEIRDFLARNLVPYQWLDVELTETDPSVKRLLDSLGDQPQLPLVLLQDGTRLEQPSAADLANRVGLRTRSDAAFYDLAIVGGGPAGLAAAVYGASEGLRTVAIERTAPGGQAGLSSRIENYLGFPSGLSGGDLARRAVTQAKRFGADILSPQEAVALQVEGPYRVLKMKDGSEVSCHSLLIATGVQWRTLKIPGIEKLQGAGVYYGGGLTEALACKDEDIYIIGGANSAGQAAMHFARFARKITMLIRGQSLAASMSQYLIDQIAATPNIDVQAGSEVMAVHGEDRLEEITIHCSASGRDDRVPAASLFIFIGAEPKTEWLDGVVERDHKGFILTGQDLMREGKRPGNWKVDRDPGLLETSVPGVFAVGDVRHGSVKRVASGVGEGSIAIQFVHQYLTKV